MNQYPHFNSKNDLTDGGVVNTQVFYPDFMDSVYLQHRYRKLQEEFAIALFDAIEHCRHPVVVECFEDKEEFYSVSDHKTNAIKLSARLTPVERRHVVINVLDGYDEKHSITYYNFHRSLDKFLNFFGIK